MRLKEIHVYGYGKLINVHIDSLTGMNVFYGKNEAGKSTLMSFIQSILFGFPAKQQAMLRYEPKSAAAYGGKIIVEHDRFGEAVIERIKGKASGDVTVWLQDGTVGGEELLSRLLPGLDKNMYQSIFSFNLQGIQDISRLKGDEIGRYLAAAGTVGTDMLIRAEQQLQKEMEQLFKPGGRKPRLNERLKELREAEQELKKAKLQNARYESVQSDLQRSRAQLKGAESVLAENEMRLKRVEELLNAWPLLEEWGNIQTRLAELGTVDFPEDGLARFEKLLDRQLSLKSRIAAIREKSAELQNRMNACSSSHSFDDSIAELLIEEWPAYERLEEEISGLERLLEEDWERASAIERELHVLSGQVQAIRHADLGLDMKGKLRDAMQQYLSADAQRQELQRNIEKEKSLLLDMETKCREIEKQLTDEDTFHQWKQQVQNFRNAEEWMDEKKSLEKDVESLERKQAEAEKKAEQKRKSTFLGAGCLLVLGIVFLVWGIFSGQWGTAALAAGTALLSVYLLKQAASSSRHPLDPELEWKRRRLKEISEFLASCDPKSKEASYRFEHQLQLRDEWRLWLVRMEQQKHHVEGISRQMKELALVLDKWRKELHSLKNRLGLSPEFSDTRIEDAFDLLKELQNLLVRQEKTKERMLQLKANESEWLNSLREFAEKAGFHKREPKEIIFWLREKVKSEKEIKLILKELAGKMAELRDEEVLLTKEISETDKKLHQLLFLAEAEDEEQFRKKAREYEEKKRHLERSELLEHQLGSLIKENPSRTSLDELQAEHALLKESIHALESGMDGCRNEIATCRHEIRVLEEGGTYTERLHEFYRLRSAFNEEAKQWARLAAAKSLLRKTMDAYKKDRFPKVLNKAEEFFSVLTDGEYHRIYLQQEDQLRVERRDRTLFDPAELSKGTGEQLYTAIRFALVYVLREEYPIPVIVDDGFVNFDRDRAGNVLKLMEKMSHSSQVLFFTCHEHLLQPLSRAKLIPLSDGVPPVEVH